MADNTFAGKNALVTGSARGIGRMVAESLGKRGANVTLNHPNEQEAVFGAEGVKAITDAGGRATSVLGDMTRLADITRLFDEAEQAHGPLDFVVCNVGGNYGTWTRIDQATEEQFDAVTTFNAKSCFFTMQQAARRLRDNGRIVALSSSTTTLAYEGNGIYSGAKAAIELYARTLAIEIGARGITVNTVAPGLTMTDAGSKASEERKEWVRQITPLQRLGVAQDVADAIVMLLGPDAHWITAQHIKAGGGAFS